MPESKPAKERKEIKLPIAAVWTLCVTLVVGSFGSLNWIHGKFNALHDEIEAVDRAMLKEFGQLGIKIVSYHKDIDALENKLDEHINQHPR